MTLNQQQVALKRLVYYRAPDNRSVNPATTAEDHERVEIITGGQVWFDDGNGGRHYGRGTIFRHSTGDQTVHISAPGNPYRCIMLLFHQLGDRPRPPRISQWTPPETLSLFRQEVLSAFHNPDFDQQVLCDYAWSTLNWHSACSAQSHQNYDLPPALRQAINYLHAHTETNVSVERLAEMCQYSKAHFHALFKKHLGMTPHRYHLEIRMKQACKQLASTPLTIKEISHHAGFESLENFYRAFYRYRGKSPGEYRRENTIPDKL